MAKTMFDYINSSTELIEENLKKRIALTETMVNEYIKGPYHNITIVASGSSNNAAQCARLYMEKVLKCKVTVISPFEFIHAEHSVASDEMVIAVSQSGYSVNTMEALKFINDELTRKSIVLTGDLNSDIVSVADLAVDFGVGEETVGYVTKGVIALSLYLMLFALEAAKMCKIIGQNEYDTWVREFEKVSGAHEKMIVATKKFYADNIKALTSLQTVYICSVGANMGTAMEGALKVGETIQVPGIAYEATGVITDKTYMLTNKKGLEGKNIINPDFEINELITPLAFLPFFQILSYQITEDTHKWKKHPLMDEMKRLAGAKTLNYESSPLRKDMPQ